MKYTCEQLAKMIDQELEAGCQLAAKYGVASVCITCNEISGPKPLWRAALAGWLRRASGDVEDRTAKTEAVIDSAGKIIWLSDMDSNHE